MSISQKTIEKITQEKITPKPRWHFLLRNDLFWGAAALSAVVGGVVLSTILHIILNRDWFIYLAPHRPAISHLFVDLPLLWLVLFGFTAYLAYYNVLHSKSGYRHSPYLVVAGSLAVSLILGGLGNFYGVGAQAEKDLSKVAPFIRTVENHTTEVWNDPDDGHLGGQVMAISDKTMEVQDTGQTMWLVDTSASTCICAMPIQVGEKVKIIGDKTSDGHFKATQIRWWDEREPRRIFRSQLPPPPPSLAPSSL